MLVNVRIRGLRSHRHSDRTFHRIDVHSVCGKIQAACGPASSASGRSERVQHQFTVSATVVVSVTIADVAVTVTL
jgi:hypothetical protein